MPDGSMPNAVDNGSYVQFAFLPGLPSGWPAIRFQGIDDNTGIWYDPEVKSFKMRFAGTDVYVFDDTGGINLAAAAGPILLPNGSSSAPSLAFIAETNTGLIRRASPSGLGFVVAGNVCGGFTSNNNEFQLVSTVPLGWSGSIWGAASDLYLWRDGAAGILAQRNTTNAQTFRIYNTFTDASNYERADFTWSSNVFEVGTVNLGTGSARSLRIKSALTIAFSLGGDRYSMSTTGFQPVADSVYDNGTASNFWKDSYYRRRITKIAVVTYSASMTPDASLGDQQIITVTNGTAFTINAPLTPITGQWMELLIKNTSGGAVGVITWNAVFKMAALTSPATGFSRTITFRYDGTNWVETGRTTADVPN